MAKFLPGRYDFIKNFLSKFVTICPCKTTCYQNSTLLKGFYQLYKDELFVWLKDFIYKHL